MTSGTVRSLSFYAQYNQLSWQFSNPGSFAIAQAYNEQFGTNYNGIYITKPQHYTSSKSTLLYYSPMAIWVVGNFIKAFSQV